MKKTMDKREMFRRYGMLAVLVVLIVIFSFGSKYFLTGDNIINVLRQVAVCGISAVGLTFIMLTGGIDLSIGTVIGMTGVMTAIAMVEWQIPMLLAVLIGLVTGLLIGLINGLLVTYVNIPALIATLGTMTSVRGLCFIVTGGLPVYNFPESFDVFGKGYISVIPVPVIIMVIILVIGWYVLNKTKYGRYLYAIGGNAEAARLSGINVKKNKVMTYVIAGLLSAVAGIVELSRLSSGQPNTGNGFEMTVITAVVLGGISVNGGEGKFFGVVVGVFVMGVLTNGMVMMNIYEYYQQLIKGIVLLVAVGFDQLSKVNKVKKMNISNTKIPPSDAEASA